MTCDAWSVQHWTVLKDGLTLFLALCVAVMALRTYRFNARTKRAEFLTSLHKSFFQDEMYKDTRNRLDENSESGPEAIRAMVQSEDASFTDFLNFFELVAYFIEMGACKKDDVEALLGYYLRLLRGSPSVYRYICDQKNDFQHLQRLLGTVKP